MLNKALVERTALGALLIATPVAVAGQERTWSVSGAVETHAYGCMGECNVRPASGWFGAGAVAVFRRGSTAQPFIGAEIGSFRWRRLDAVLAWHGTAGPSFGSGRIALRKFARLPNIPDRDTNQLHGALGVGVRF